MLRALRESSRQEDGQMLIVMVLAMTLVLMIGVIVVDFGMWFSGRASAVNAVDAAAMAGSLHLPQDGTDATSAALHYVQTNDPEIQPGDVDTSFRCIAGDRDHNGQPDSIDITINCPQVVPAAFSCTDALCYANCAFSGASPKCNTIVVQGSKNVPFGFASAFGISGGASAGFTSAACTGACGGPPTIPLDIVMIIDRTGSMSSSDLSNAEAAAKSVLTFFDPEQQRVALGVLGPSSTTSKCTGANSGGLGIAASSGGSWVPVGFSTDYQNSDGSLNNNSLIVKTINCLQTSSVGTDLGDPLQAAINYLAANGRPGVKKGIIFETDGEANVGGDTTISLPTGQRYCTSQSAVNSGDRNGYEGNTSGACADGGAFATDANSGTSTSTSCTSGNKDAETFTNFGVAPSSSLSPTIDGIQIRLDSWYSVSTPSTHQVCVALSWNGGTTWTAAKTQDLTTSQATYLLGSAVDDWGHSWTTGNLANGLFVVKVTDVASNTSTTFNLDAVAANVFYHYTTTAPCNYAYQQAQVAQTAGINTFTIGFGLEGAICSSDDTASPYRNVLVTTLLANMATQPTVDDGGDGPGGLGVGCDTTAEQNSENADEDNFLCEPKSQSLQAVFQAAAQALASGSRLVKIPF